MSWMKIHVFKKSDGFATKNGAIEEEGKSIKSGR